MDKLSLGVDLGGSHISVAAVDSSGAILLKEVAPLSRNEEHDRIIDQMIDMLRSLRQNPGLNGRQADRIGVGVPGVIDMDRGVTLFIPNLKGEWRGVPLKDRIEGALDMPMVLANDVRCFTLAEFRFGAGKGSTHMVGLAIGTGIGGGLIVNGKVHTGLDGVAGEIGHIIIDVNGPRCGCGSYGCMEALAASPAIVSMAVRAVRQSAGATKIAEYAEGDLNKVTAETVARAARDGDFHAVEIMDRVGFYLGVGISNLLALLSPDCVVIGGGVAKAGEVLFEPIRKTLKATVHTAPLDKIRIAAAQLGTDAGVIGAATWAMASA
ncbi:MAG: ROK family protein [Armatimonadetes bacterium]|nr:ROK family protein [Armatimonadota bacterium]